MILYIQDKEEVTLQLARLSVQYKAPCQLYSKWGNHVIDSKHIVLVHILQELAIRKNVTCENQCCFPPPPPVS